MSIIVIKFGQLYYIARSHKMGSYDGVLVYRLLNNAKLPEEKEQLVRATVSEIKYETLMNFSEIYHNVM